MVIYYNLTYPLYYTKLHYYFIVGVDGKRFLIFFLTLFAKNYMLYEKIILFPYLYLN